MNIEKLDGYKKLGAAALASILALIAFALDLDSTTVGIIITPLTGYILAQGAADWGKSAAKINSRNLPQLEFVELVEQEEPAQG